MQSSGDSKRQRPAAPVSRPMAHRPATPTARASRGMLPLLRTIIPILLTMGVFLPSLGIWWMRLSPDSPFTTMPTWTPVALFTAGAVSAVLAVVNMILVRQATRRLR